MKFSLHISIVTAFLAFVMAIGSLFPVPAEAHARGENYVWVNIEADHVSGRFEINKHDIKSKLGIDLDVSEGNTLETVKLTAPQVQQYLLDNFSLSYNGEQKEIQFLEPSLFDDNGNPFIQYHYRTEGVPENDLAIITNTIFLSDALLKDDPLHRSLIVLEYNKFRGLEFGHETTTLVFGPHMQESSLNVADPPGILIWKDFFYQGLLHIWIGLDHMLFLFSLLLTVVLVRENQSWEPVPKARNALFNTLKIVTVFTISHSITLALAVLGLVNVPAAPVEAVIALSIIAMALNNIFPMFSTHTWVLVFAFGLIHGLGFASALGDLQFRNVSIKKILIMFNVGVELGQIVVVILVLPILIYFRKSITYRKIIMPGVSLLAVVLASYWLGSRVGWWG